MLFKMLVKIKMAVWILLILKLIWMAHGSKNRIDHDERALQEVMAKSKNVDTVESAETCSSSDTDEWEEEITEKDRKSNTNEQSKPKGSKRFRSDDFYPFESNVEPGDWICERCTYKNDISDTKTCSMCYGFRNTEYMQQAVAKNALSIFEKKYHSKNVNFVGKLMKDENVLNQVEFLEGRKKNDLRTENPQKFLRKEFNFLVSDYDGEAFTIKYVHFKALDESVISKWGRSIFERIPRVCKRTVANYLCLNEQFQLARTCRLIFRDANHGEYAQVKTSMLYDEKACYRVTFDVDKLEMVSIELKTDGTKYGKIDPTRKCCLSIKIGKLRFIMPSNTGWYEYSIEGWVNFPNLGVQFMISSVDSVEVIARRMEQMKYISSNLAYMSKIEIKRLSGYTGPAVFESSGEYRTGLETSLRLYQRKDTNLKK